jgi:hypothetical protein
VSINVVNRRIIMTPALASGGFTPTSAQSAAFLARATNVTSIADKTNYDTLITGLVTDGIFSQLDVLYIFAAVDATTARLNLIQNNFNATETGTVSFSAYNGFTGDGSTGFENSGFVAASAGGNYTQNSASFGIYILSNNAGSNSVEIGASDGTNNLSDAVTRQGAGNSVFRINDQGANALLPTNATRAGMYVASRTGANQHDSYKNGSSTATGTPNSFSITSLPAFYVCARNDSGTATSFSIEQASAAFIGGGLTATGALNLSTRINTYMTAYGINVY